VIESCRTELSRGAEAISEGLPPEVVVEHLRFSLKRMGELLGKNFTEGVLDEIFSRFCIGK